MNFPKQNSQTNRFYLVKRKKRKPNRFSLFINLDYLLNPAPKRVLLPNSRVASSKGFPSVPATGLAG